MADHLRAGLRCETMALKTNFTDSNDIASPFVDEVANPGTTNKQSDKLLQKAKTQRLVREYLDATGTKAKVK